VTAGAAMITTGLSIGAPLALGAIVLPAPAALVTLVAIGALLVVVAFRRLTPPGTLGLARGLPAAISLRGVLTVAFFAVYAYVSLALIDWRGLPAGLAGLAIAGGSLTWTAGAWIQARGARARGYPFFVRAGFGTIAVGTLGIVLGLDLGVPLVVVYGAFGLIGLGMGLAYAPQSLIVLREAALAEQGAATSALSVADLLGTALGTGVTGAILAAGLRSGATIGGALLPAFLLAAAVAVIGLVLSGRLVTDRPAAARAGLNPAGLR